MSAPVIHYQADAQRGRLSVVSPIATVVAAMRRMSRGVPETDIAFIVHSKKRPPNQAASIYG